MRLSTLIFLMLLVVVTAVVCGGRRCPGEPRLWPDAEVYFTISDRFSKGDLKKIELAM